MSYKEMEKELEKIIADLESGEVEFEKASALFQKGADLVKQMHNMLQAEKGKVAIIKNELGKITEESFNA